MYKDKTCKICKTEFTPKAPATLYCDNCATPSLTKEYKRKAIMLYRMRQGGHEIGVGSGNHSLNRGKTSPTYKNGIKAFYAHGKRIKEIVGLCARCGVDIKNVKPSGWATHHKDHNKDNNDVTTNLEVLCKRCHQVEHECVKNFNDYPGREYTQVSGSGGQVYP